MDLTGAQEFQQQPGPGFPLVPLVGPTWIHLRDQAPGEGGKANCLFEARIPGRAISIEELCKNLSNRQVILTRSR